MGLDVSHDCWHGAYSAFMRWREAIARAAGIPDLRSMEGFTEHGVPWASLGPDPLWVLLSHSDCDGIIEAKDCAPIADRLEQLLSKLPGGPGGGHIWDWREVTQTFIGGLREASAAGEDVEFH